MEKLTADGYDMAWGTNALGKETPVADERTLVLSAFCKTGHFYFTKLLLPALLKGSTPENKSRVVNTSSASSIGGISMSGSGLDFATFKDSPNRRKYNTTQLYGQSKFVRAAITIIGVIDKPKTFSTYKGNVLFTQEFARRHGDKIVTTAVHPG